MENEETEVTEVAEVNVETPDQEAEVDIVELLQGKNKENWCPRTISFFGPESRSIPLVGPINSELALAVVSQLQELSTQDEEAPILMHINTEGGAIVEALAIYDVIRMIPNPVVAFVNGMCASAGFIILSAADVRVCTKHSLFYWHQVMAGFAVDSTEALQDHTRIYDSFKKITDKIVRKRASISKKKWKKIFGSTTSKHFFATKAKEYGFIDQIVVDAKKVGLTQK